MITSNSDLTVGFKLLASFQFQKRKLDSFLSNMNEYLLEQNRVDEFRDYVNNIRNIKLFALFTFSNNRKILLSNVNFSGSYMEDTYSESNFDTSRVTQIDFYESTL